MNKKINYYIRNKDINNIENTKQNIKKKFNINFDEKILFKSNFQFNERNLKENKFIKTKNSEYKNNKESTKINSTKRAWNNNYFLNSFNKKDYLKINTNTSIKKKNNNNNLNKFSNVNKILDFDNIDNNLIKTKNSSLSSKKKQIKYELKTNLIINKSKDKCKNLSKSKYKPNKSNIIIEFSNSFDENFNNVIEPINILKQSNNLTVDNLNNKKFIINDYKILEEIKSKIKLKEEIILDLAKQFIK